MPRRARAGRPSRRGAAPWVVSLGAVARAQALPDGRRVLGPCLDLIGQPVGDRAHGQPLVRRDRQHVDDPVIFRPAADGAVASVDAVARDPGKRQLGRARPFQQGKAQRRLGRGGRLIGHMRGPAAGAVVRPRPGQVERPVDQRVAVAPGIPGEHLPVLGSTAARSGHGADGDDPAGRRVRSAPDRDEHRHRVLTEGRFAAHDRSDRPP